jgi:hypothetical protein
MDTRSKILSCEQALGLSGRIAIATGTFNPMRAACARELDELRQSAAPDALLVIVLPACPELLSQAARVELVAALRVVDRVTAATSSEAEELIRRLMPAAVLRLEEAHRERTAELIAHVRKACAPAPEGS